MKMAMRFLNRLTLSQIIFLMMLVTSAFNAKAQNDPVRPRIVITADPELDDNNSLIRFLLYSSDVQIEGLIYASSGFHWKGDGKGTKWFVPNREYNRFGQDKCPCEILALGERRTLHPRHR
ncbi:MAG: hypothetical protein QM762_21435 [Chryseolinea sp.]